MITEKYSNGKKLFLLDAYALIFRAYYAFIKNPRYNSKGLNTSAILGFTNTVHEILQKEKPDYMGVVFDPPGKNFRDEIFPEYKANRDATPEDIKLSVPYIKKILNAMKIPVVEIPGFEADDTIGTLAKKAEKEGFTVFMVTPDKDYGQLVSDNIFMYKPKRGNKDTEILGKTEICELYGIEKPEQVIDILAIWGDSADNIPGIPGIGEKTSKKLIAKFGTAENLIKNVNQLKGKQKENVANSKELVTRSKILVTIKIDVPVEFNSEEYKTTTANYTELEKLFNELEFNALKTRMFPQAPKKATNKKDETKQKSLFAQEESEEVISSENTRKKYNPTKQTYQTLESPYEIEELAKKLNSVKEFCFDTETDAADAHKAQLVGIAFSFKANEAFYIPIPEDKETAGEILKILSPALENEDILKIGQNIKYDLLVLSNHNQKVKGKLFDTMIAHYLIDTDSKHNLTYLSEKFLNYSPIEIEEIAGKKITDGTMRKVALEKITTYACEDADLTFQLKHILKQKLEADDLLQLAENIEFPLIHVLTEMENNGVTIDLEQLKTYETELIEKLKETETEIYKLAETEFNISSPKQLGIILFEKLKISENPKLTKTKQYATGEKELLKLEKKHEIVSHILDYRSNSKLLSTYVKALPKLINKNTGKLHTTFNQAVVSTGRLSSTNPNLQNIPIRTEEGRKIREAFIPSSSDNVLISADYSQIELRLMAHLSQDENMLSAFQNNEDIHSATAAKIFDTKQENVTKEMRSKAKSANFGIIYGVSAFGLSTNLNISRSEAKSLIDGYFNSYPKVKEYMDNSIREARQNNNVRTLFGRKRILHNINSNNGLQRSNDERNAINAPIQGSGSDIIKLAMTECHKKIKERGLKSQMLLQVHDELLFDVPESEKEEMKNLIKEAMENAAKLSVKLKVDIGEGKNWLEAH